MRMLAVELIGARLIGKITRGRSVRQHGGMAVGTPVVAMRMPEPRHQP